MKKEDGTTHTDEFESFLAARNRDDPGVEFWDSYYENLVTRMNSGREHEKLSTGSFSRGQELLDRLRDALLPSPRLAWQMVLGVFILVSGILLGKYGLQADHTNDLASSTEFYSRDQSPVVNVAPAAESAIIRAHTVLGRSRTLLLGVVNFDLNSDDPASLALQRRRDIARTLIVESADLSKELESSDQLQLSLLIGELEIILLQIANLEEIHALSGVELIQNGVNRKSLLFKIDIAEMRRLDRQLRTDKRKAGQPMSQV